jgi:alkanesulfonate monooxygenase SsuD/methylene tetrahydromethanopterin reductase-like flavin-dependent oxidoreductase (luciferase family)
MAQGTPDLTKIIDLAVQAEALGFDSIWVGDSILARPRLEALTTLAAVASRTTRVKLGTAVLLSALRHPVVLANEAANVDILSHGRLILGLGIATRTPTVECEFAACGVAFGRRIGIFQEGVEMMRRLWTDPHVTFSGRHFQIQDVSLGLRPIQQGGIPIWLAPEALTDMWGRLQRIAREMGRDPAALHRCVYTTLNVNADVAQAEREMRAFVEGYYGAPYETLSRMQGLCSGTAQACAKWLQDFVAAGAQTIVIRFGGPDQFGQLERCTKEVLPQVG